MGEENGFYIFFNRLGVAGAVLRTPFSATYPFPPNLQNIIAPKPLRLGTCNFCHISCVTFPVSRVNINHRQFEILLKSNHDNFQISFSSSFSFKILTKGWGCKNKAA